MKLRVRKILYALRTQRNLSQKQIAQDLGISRSYYTHIEQGTKTPSLKEAVKIARYFYVSVEELFADVYKKTTA